MLVDDEESIRALVGMIVTDEGYTFCCAADGLEAINLYDKEQPDLLILDIMMPNLSGFEVCRQLRAKGNNVPIIILSAKSEIVDKSIGFRAGADDYLVKPFSPIELLLRIEAILRRRENNLGKTDTLNVYVAGDMEFCFKRREVKVQGRVVELTPKEFIILSYMAAHPGEIFSKEQLQEYVWGENYTGELTSIAVFIRKIREKIENNPGAPRYLQTVWGMGYRFCKN
jgi:two-component system response regulator VicR